MSIWSSFFSSFLCSWFLGDYQLTPLHCAAKTLFIPIFGYVLTTLAKSITAERPNVHIGYLHNASWQVNSTNQKNKVVLLLFWLEGNNHRMSWSTHTHTAHHHLIILYNITLFLGRQCGWTDNAGFNWTRTILLFENIFIKCSTQIWDFSSAKRKIESLRWAYVVVNSYPVVRDLSPVWPFMHGVSEK